MAPLSPCRECGSECRVEEFSGAHMQGIVTLLLCSNHHQFDGDCNSDIGCFDAETWNAENASRWPVEPTQWGDDVAAEMRAYFDAHKHEKWQRGTADNLMLGLFNIAARALSKEKSDAR